MVGRSVERLRTRLFVVGVGYALAVGAGYVLLDAIGTFALRRWLLPASAVAVAELVVCWRYLPTNHRPGGETVLGTFGIANALTLSRGVAVALAAGFLLVPRPSGVLAWVPAVLCALCGLGDYFDGLVARRTDRRTALGARLDIEFDALATAVVVALAVAHGQVPGWYLAVGLARYLFVGATALRRWAGNPVASLPESAARRYLYAVQFTFATIVLTPVVGPPVTTAVAMAVAGAFLAGFLRDWLAVTGRLDGHVGRDGPANED
jgi:CDP-diacylglycerol--glycerol-3-phosphate 3-phosphatidyltransferase